jgi:integrase
VIPTRDEVDQLAEASDSRLHAAVELAGYCGLRQGELLALSRIDVDLVKNTVFVHQARNKASGAIESTKTDAARVVHLPLRVHDSLTIHLDEYDGALLFPVTASVFDKSWRHARHSAGLAGVRFHDLRHAAASMMIHAGWNINQVSKQLGHANPTMTLNIYAHLWPDSFTEAIAKMDQYLAHD